MGSYGIGVERAMAVIAEVHHDDAGLAWPVQVAPAEVTVLLLSVTRPEAQAAAEDAVLQPARRRRWTRRSTTGTSGLASSTRTPS